MTALGHIKYVNDCDTASPAASLGACISVLACKGATTSFKGAKTFDRQSWMDQGYNAITMVQMRIGILSISMRTSAAVQLRTKMHVKFAAFR